MKSSAALILVEDAWYDFVLSHPELRVPPRGVEEMELIKLQWQIGYLGYMLEAALKPRVRK